jgi:hypothetical protein
MWVAQRCTAMPGTVRGLNGVARLEAQETPEKLVAIWQGNLLQ